MSSLLQGVRFLKIDWDDWTTAAGLGRRLAADGHRLPLSDLVLAAVSIRLDAEIYSIDPHFTLIAELKRFSA